MGEEEKDTVLKAEGPETEPVDAPSAEEPKESMVEVEKPGADPNGLASKRGRMVATGLVTAVILSIIAVIVAGIFQITSRLLVQCPTDLPVNDPAPILWNDITSPQVKARPLGISEKIAGETKLKEAPPAEPETEVKSGDNK
jgi:hypothetical protein